MNPAMVLGTALVVVLAMLQPLSAQSSRGDAALSAGEHVARFRPHPVIGEIRHRLPLPPII